MSKCPKIELRGLGITTTVCMYVCMYVCMFVCLFVCMNACSIWRSLSCLFLFCRCLSSLLSVAMDRAAWIKLTDWFNILFISFVWIFCLVRLYLNDVNKTVPTETKTFPMKMHNYRRIESITDNNQWVTEALN